MYGLFLFSHKICQHRRLQIIFCDLIVMSTLFTFSSFIFYRFTTFIFSLMIRRKFMTAYPEGSVHARKIQYEI